jgi:sugar lactone lactonase YvrE
MSYFSCVKYVPFLLLSLVACKKDNPTAGPLTYTTVSTVAGRTADGFLDGPSTVAQFSAPEGVTIDAEGNLYVADAVNARIRKITPAGIVSTLAGTGRSGYVNGASTTAQFNYPADVVLDAQHNVYVADQENHCIRKITPQGTVSTFAGTGASGFKDGVGKQAQFSIPDGLAIDAQGNVYVTELGNNRIRKITPTGLVSTVAGGLRGYMDGPSSRAQFLGLEGITIDAQGTLYVAEFAGNRIRKITADGTVSTLAGSGTKSYADGLSKSAQFNGPTGLTLDAQGNVYVAELGNNCIRKITPAGEVSTLAGSIIAGAGVSGYDNGPVGTARFVNPSGIVADAQGVLYVTEYANRIRKITAD